MIKTSRIYGDSSGNDGYRILVDRLWPRGLRKETAGVDLWLKEIAPSAVLRKWFAHDPAKWKAFLQKYHDELKGKPELIEKLVHLHHQHGTLTLLYSAKDERHNNAVALAEFLQNQQES